MSLSLTELGWSDDVASLFSEHANPGATPGRVAAVHRGEVDVFFDHHRRRALVRGVDPEDPDGPTVGDWVAVRVVDDPGIPAIVETVLPRRTRFMRKTAGRRSDGQVIAANIDVVLIATSVNQDFNPRRLERTVAAVRGGGAEAVIVLTKADLVEDLAPFLDPLPGVPCVAVSALDGDGLDQLDGWIGPGRTVALIGSSGVGKSTLANALLGVEVQDTGGIRRTDDRGKHTTTTRVMLPLPQGGLLIDTPGIREIGLVDGALDELFEDVTRHTAACLYRDCAHEGEEGCGVQAALDSGELDESRVRAWRKLGRELAHEARRRRSKHEERQRARTWEKSVKARAKAQKALLKRGAWD